MVFLINKHVKFSAESESVIGFSGKPQGKSGKLRKHVFFSNADFSKMRHFFFLTGLKIFVPIPK